MKLANITRELSHSQIAILIDLFDSKNFLEISAK